MLYPALFKWLGGIKSESPLFYLSEYDGTVTREAFKPSVHKMRFNKGFFHALIFKLF